MSLTAAEFAEFEEQDRIGMKNWSKNELVGDMAKWIQLICTSGALDQLLDYEDAGHALLVRLDEIEEMKDE